ncbi:MAG: PKD domain-containing protein [Thermoplasmata archaeon]|nr:PKD domain-containing protein [Thermoplasmata archaeon]MCI4337695.1 PKD domain-containing protein [Thermoplasmata archaeon]MCI4340831.1 PKD domain-containing protein [Thermoplasmata archaeon]
MGVFLLLALAAPAVASAGHSGVSGAGRFAVDTPVLSLIPTPQTGGAPLPVNVSASVSSGVAPFTVSVCFATSDHSSPPSSCNGTVSGWNGATPLRFPHLYANPGNYSVTGILTDARGAGVGSTVLIVVTNGSALQARATESGTAGVAPFSVQFTETVAGETPPLSIQWLYGDGSTGSSLPGLPVTHVYSSPGNYWPSLVVADGAGHRTVRALPTVAVSAPTGGLLGLGGGNPWGAILLEAGLFVLAAVVTVVLVRGGLRRRWRREGNELIDRIRAPEPAQSLRPVP